MAKKTKKQKQRAATRRPSSAPRPQSAVAVDDEAPATAAAEATEDEETGGGVTTTVPAPVSQRRRVERVGAGQAAQPAQRRPQGARRGVTASAAAMVAPLESDDPAVPFDRAPYVPADLRRVAIMASLMIALIIIADIVVHAVVK